MSTAPALRRLEPVQPAVAELAADIGLLLRRGRVGVAMKQLEKLPELVRDEITDRLGAASWAGYCRGFEAGRAALAAEIMGAKPKRPKKPTNAEWLRERLADPVLRERAKATLRLNDELLDAIAEGGVGLGSSSWRRLRRELGP
jgi:hypothetical protein